MPTPKKHRISRQRQAKNCLDQNYSLTQLKQTWFSRALLMGQNLRLLAKSIELYDGIVTLLALDEVDFEEHKTSEVQRIIKKQASLFANPISENQETAFVNIVRMKQDFGFSEVEIQLLLFASILDLDGEFSECIFCPNLNTDSDSI